MAVFKSGSKTPSGANGKPSTGAVPEGGYGSYGVPSKAQKTSIAANKPSGSGKKGPALKPSGGHGTYGKPSAGTVPKGGTGSGSGKQRMGSYANDGMAEPKTPIPSDQKTGRFNLPKGKFTY